MSDDAIAALKGQIAALEAELAALEGTKTGPKVSPLAPKAGFPALPKIDGVTFASARAGVKYKERDDVMLARVCAGARVAGVFTRSSTRSAPVLWCQEALAGFDTDASGDIGILVNSGNSNAFTGRAGEASVTAVANACATALGTEPSRVFMSSTGVIGEPLPDAKITAVINDLVAGQSADDAPRAARAIMTTDTYPKGATATADCDGTTVTVSGFAKGSGMIAPDMATMLVYIFTDAKVDQAVLQAMVSTENTASFNAITVDSDTSTSDTLIVAATGRAGMEMIRDAGSPAGQALQGALRSVMLDLAHQVVRDGEGATKFVAIRVKGAKSDASAQVVARAIANSPLVKTAIAGEDPNWGRVVMAIGKSGEPADRDLISIWFGDILVADKGWRSPDYREAQGADYMKAEDLEITVELGIGDGSATVWTCDLTHDYISINADYRS